MAIIIYIGMFLIQFKSLFEVSGSFSREIKNVFQRKLAKFVANAGILMAVYKLLWNWVEISPGIGEIILRGPFLHVMTLGLYRLM